MKKIPPSLVAIVINSLLMSSLFPYLAHAVDSGGYMGLAAGSASYTDQELIGLCGDFGLDCTSDTKGSAFKFWGGYRFNPYLAIEAGYADWGEVSVEPVGSTALTFATKGPYMSLMPEFPVSDKFSLFGELGLAYQDANLSASIPFLGEIDSISEKAIIPIFGLGAAINLDSITIRFQWERIDPNETYTIEGFDISSPKLDLYTIGALIRF